MPSTMRLIRVLPAVWLLTAPLTPVLAADGPAGPPAAASACGVPLSPAIVSAWTAAGAEHGKLGCPSRGEDPSARSPQGSTAHEARFATGTIVLHTSGPLTGQAFAVAACYRLYFQYGGPSGWLGLPISDAVNTPDGRRQAFEGGRLTLNRALNDCEDDHETTQAASVGANPLAPLDLFRDPANLDNVTAGSQREIDRLLAAGYRRVRTEAVVLAEPAPGAAALKLFWNEALGAHQTVATAQGERDAAAAGYIYDGVQGFIWPGPGPGLHPLKQYRSLLTGRLRLIGAPDGEAEAVAQGFVFLRIEGYAPIG